MSFCDPPGENYGGAPLLVLVPAAGGLTALEVSTSAALSALLVALMVQGAQWTPGSRDDRFSEASDRWAKLRLRIESEYGPTVGDCWWAFSQDAAAMRYAQVLRDTIWEKTGKDPGGDLNSAIKAAYKHSKWSGRGIQTSYIDWLNQTPLNMGATSAAEMLGTKWGHLVYKSLYQAMHVDLILDQIGVSRTIRQEAMNTWMKEITSCFERLKSGEISSIILVDKSIQALFNWLALSALFVYQSMHRLRSDQAAGVSLEEALPHAVQSTWSHMEEQGVDLRTLPPWRSGVMVPERSDGSEESTYGATYLEGVDVHHGKGTIDWRRVAGSGVDYALLKVTDGINLHHKGPSTMHDAPAQRNAAGAKQNGLKVGYYHFAFPRSTPSPAADGRAQAHYFLSTLNKLDLPRADFPLVLDFEPVVPKAQREGDRYWRKWSPMSNAQLTEWVFAFLRFLEDKTGVPPMLYTSANYASHISDHQALKRYPLWIANYTSRSTPTLPSGLSSWSIWQYSAKGSVPGISGHVDMNRSTAAKLQVLEQMQAGTRVASAATATTSAGAGAGLGVLVLAGLGVAFMARGRS